MTDTMKWLRKHSLLLLSLLFLVIAAFAAATFLKKVQSRVRAWTGTSNTCEQASYPSPGQLEYRPRATDRSTLIRFGSWDHAPWEAKEENLGYSAICTPQMNELYLKLRYSKDSPATVPIFVYFDAELSPRAILYPTDQHSLKTFAWTDPVPLGPVSSGRHVLRLTTEGQTKGVADLGEMILTTTP